MLLTFLALAILTQNKAVSKAKARNPKSPEREIQTGLNCGYDGFSEVILALLTLAGTYVKVHLHKMVYSILLFNFTSFVLPEHVQMYISISFHVDAP